MLDVPGLGAIRASLVDAANPCVLIAAADVGITGTEAPAALERNTALLQRLEAIRQAGAVAMGMAPDLAAAARVASVPKLAMLSAPVDSTIASGRTLAASEVDILCRMISVGQPHRAVPLTGALCLAVACRIPGSLAQALVRAGAPDAPLRIGHPSGVILVSASVWAQDGRLDVPYATVFRTARRLFQGEVLYRAAAVRVEKTTADRIAAE